MGIEAQDAPDFDVAFRAGFLRLLRWRRDVRHFRTDPVPEALLEELLDAACLAPSVGNSQPWRFVLAESDPVRRGIRENFEQANARALQGYDGERARLYATLKLSGLVEAPAQLAVFTDEATPQGHGLGRQTMPETLRYSTAIAIHALWLAARMHGLGVGWVSILDPEAAARLFAVPEGWAFTAYLCIGWPQEEHLDPELERVGWQARTDAGRALLRR